MQARRLLVRTTLAALCVTAGVGILVLLTRSFDDTTWRILGTTTTISVCALLAVPVGVLLERGVRRLLARAPGALTGATLLLTVAGIWHTPHDVGYAKGWAVIATLALAAAAVAVMRRGAGPIGQTHRLRLGGRLVESPGRDFAAAAANAIREAERDGQTVRHVERA